MDRKWKIKENQIMFNIVLVEPEIPQNTGNIARTCAATGSRLHLVKPLGFSLDDRYLKRAGLDYWPYVDVTVYESLADFMEQHGEEKLYLATTKGGQFHTDVTYEDGSYILFGKETAGLPRDFIDAHADTAVRIPMGEEVNLRSLNLSNSAAIILYEALRQQGFPGLY